MNRRLLPILIFLLITLCGFAFAESAPAATAAAVENVTEESERAEESQPTLIQNIATINGKVNDFVWGVPAMALILGVGLYLTIGTRVIQIRKLKAAMKETIGKLFSRQKAGAGAVTPFQAVCTALHGQYRGRRGRNCAGRPGRGVLDVDFGVSGHVHEIRRGHARRSLPRAQRKGRLGRRPDVLHQKRPF